MTEGWCLVYRASGRGSSSITQMSIMAIRKVVVTVLDLVGQLINSTSRKRDLRTEMKATASRRTLTNYHN